MEFLKSIGGKIVTAVLVLAVIAAGVAWWQASPQTRQAAWDNSIRLLGWFVLVVVVPWALFWLIAWVESFKSNGAGAILVGLLTVLEAVLLAWLFSFDIQTALAWTLLIATSLAAGVYNVLACDWIAEKVGS